MIGPLMVPRSTVCFFRWPKPQKPKTVRCAAGSSLVESGGGEDRRRVTPTSATTETDGVARLQQCVSGDSFGHPRPALQCHAYSMDDTRASLTALVPPQQQQQQQQRQQQRQFKHVIFTPENKRFNTERPRPKRQRITVACNTCRSRKVKCDGTRPACEGCLKNGTTCVYAEDEDAAQSRHRCSGSFNVEGSGPQVSTASDHGTFSSTDLRSPNVVSASSNASHDVGFGASQFSTSRMVEPTSSSNVRIPYFRWFGPTGIVPGFTKVLVDLRRTQGDRGESTTPPPARSAFSPPERFHTSGGYYQDATSPASNLSSASMIFDDEDPMIPNTEVLGHLLDMFFAYFGSHFPFYRKDRFMASVRAKSVPAVLLNTMCALAARFSRHPRIHRDPIYLSGEKFGDKAKQLVIVLLAVPSYDVVASLLMLSWYEFGCNRDVGFWMYTGMAIRMAQDLGMHKKEERSTADAMSSHSNVSDSSTRSKDEIEEESALRLNLFWAIFFIDRVISLGTGRPLTLRDEQISCPLPPNDNNPYRHMLRIMSVQGKVNEEISTIRQPSDLTDARRQTIKSLQDELLDIYTNLESRLSFNVSNFQTHVALGQGGSFLLLHIWFHAVIITIHRPGLMHGGADTLAHTLGEQSLEVSMSSAKTITAILGLAELVDDKTIVGTPFLNQAVYIAGLAFIAEQEMYAKVHSNAQLRYGGGEKDLARYGVEQPTSPQSVAEPPTSASRSLLRLASKRNYETCLHTEEALKRYWRGIGWILSTMEQKALGLAHTDPSEESVDPASGIDLRDAGMLRRLLAVRHERRKAVSSDPNGPAGAAETASQNDGHGAPGNALSTQRQREVVMGMGFAGREGHDAGGSEETMAILYPEAWTDHNNGGSLGLGINAGGGGEWDDLAWLDGLGSSLDGINWATQLQG